jgi:hypothetical protein
MSDKPHEKHDSLPDALHFQAAKAAFAELAKIQSRLSEHYQRMPPACSSQEWKQWDREFNELGSAWSRTFKEFKTASGQTLHAIQQIKRQTRSQIRASKR